MAVATRKRYDIRTYNEKARIVRIINRVTTRKKNPMTLVDACASMGIYPGQYYTWRDRLQLIHLKSAIKRFER